MNEEVLRARARFVLVTLTTPIQVDPDVAKREETQRALGASDLFYTERRLRQLGKRFGFPVITLAEELQAAAVQRHVYFYGFSNTAFGTGHFNERGHEIVADILTRELVPFLPESRHGKAPEAGDLLPSNSISRGSPSGSPGLNSEVVFVKKKLFYGSY